VFSQTKLTHLFVGDFDTGREVFGDEVAFDGQSCWDESGRDGVLVHEFLVLHLQKSNGPQRGHPCD
jgi:hypothetical protein